MSADPGDEDDSRMSECRDGFRHVWRVEQRERDLPRCLPLLCLRCLQRGYQFQYSPVSTRVEFSATLEF